MSYQVIARKWRPQTFEEVTGQSHVTTPLRNAIAGGRVPHAILLTGPRGVGKTTLARILARCLNCDNGPTDSPCGECASCLEIASGASTDVQEIDAASRTGVDDVREVIEAIRYAASPGKHRIFVVDEVHMLSTAAFNALLKTLEEPPPRSLFVFATTNPEKIPFTVLSRCQRYDLRLFSTAEVAARLGEICRADGIEISESSLLALAREGQGSMRDSQTLLDQVIAYGGTKVSDETVSSVLDLVDRRVLLGILQACVDSDPAAALEACGQALRSGTDAKRLCSSLIQHLRDLVVLRVAPKAPGLVEGSEEELAELRKIAEGTDELRLRRMFRALVKEQEDLTWAPQPFAVLEMALIRLASMPSGDDVGRLLSRLEGLERRLAGGGGGGSGGGPAPATPRSGGSSKPSPRGGARGAAAASAKPDPAPASAAAEATPPAASAAPTAPGADSGNRHDSAATDPAEGEGPAAPLPVVLDRLRVFAQKRDRGLFISLDEATLLAQRAGHVKLEVVNAFHRKRLQDRALDVDRVCSEFFGAKTRAEIVSPAQPAAAVAAAPGSRRGQQPASSARENETARRREEERRRKRDALNHAGINIALEVLEADIVEIRPLGGK